MPSLLDDPYYTILRGSGFEAEGIVRERGEIVDTTNWRTVRGLVDRRVLGPIPCRIEDARLCACGRKWTDRASVIRHERKSCPAKQQNEQTVSPVAQAA